MFSEEEFLDTFKSALEDKDYIYLEPMNKSGGWAEIFYIYSREDKEVRVAKVYNEALGRITEEIYKSDAKKLMKIDHENVVKIFDKSIIEYDEKKYFFLILEHIKGKNFEEIDSRIFFEKPYYERLNYLNQALDGINEFRVNLDLHRDLHPGNIMLSDENKSNVKKIKIIDPGSSRYYYEPIDEDIDLYSIKESLLNLFLQPNEINKINESVELKNLDFPELRKLIIKLSIEKEKKTFLNQNNKNYQAKAQELLLKVHNKEISISVILPEYYDFLRKINEKKEEQWVEAELSGNISELGKDHPEYFEYRKIKGYISPNELVSAGMYSLDIIAANEKSLMFKHEYIPSISIHELEKFLETSTGFGQFTLSKKYMDSIEVDIPGISEFYFYFKPSGVIRIVANIRSKIGAFLVQYIRK